MDTPKTDGTPDTQTLNWAKKVGYQPDQGLKRRQARKRHLFTEIGTLQQTSPPPPPPQTQTQTSTIVNSTPSPLQIDVTDTKRIVMKRALKGGSDKKTCFVEFGGKTLVVKGGSGDSADHVTASEFIGKLGLKGVRVPAVRLLTDAEKTALSTHFSQGDSHAKELGDSLVVKNPDGNSSGQISELSDGVAPENFFLDKLNKKWFGEAVARREEFLAQKDKFDKDAAWTSVYQTLLERSSGAATLAGIKQRVGAATPAEKAQALQWLKDNVVSAKQKHWVAILDDIESDKLAQGLARMQDEEKERTDRQGELKKFAESDAGIEAFAGLAAADLVSGMDDRIMTKFNGGNFLFDKKANELVCVDNSKNPMRALNVPEDQSQWQFHVSNPLGKSATLEEAIYLRIYGKGEGSGAEGDTPSAPGNYVDFDDQKAATVKETIRKTLADVVARIGADPNQNPAAIKRAAFIKARMQVDALYRDTQLPAPPVPPAKLDAGDKIARASKSFFTSNKKDKRKDTQKIKDDLRAGTITAAQARQQLLALEQQSPKLANDRRSQKIKYLADVYEACETLESLADDWTRMLAALPPGVAINSNLKVMKQGLQTAFVDNWQAALAGDKKGLALFNTAWGKFPQELRNA